MSNRPGVSDAEFVELFKEYGATEASRRLNITERKVYARRESLERRLKIPIPAPSGGKSNWPRPKQYPHRIHLEIGSGTIIVASDAHYWPGPPSLMHKALVTFCKEYKPKAVIFNGDVIDAPTISRHAPIGWETRPQLADEIEAAKERLSEIEKATFKARKIWPLGNHDQRFESRIASVAPEYAKIHGVHLKDHFIHWEPCWSVWINNDVICRHKQKAGEHAPFNNTRDSGKSTITGHLHSAKVYPVTDYNGTRWGVDTGCIADTDAKAFVDYMEGAADMKWRSAFCVLTFKDGRLLQPELVLKWNDDSVQFRGEIIKV